MAEELKELLGPGRKEREEKERLQRWRIGNGLMVLGVLLAGASVTLALWAGSALHLLYLPAAATVWFLGHHLARRNVPAFVSRDARYRLRRSKLAYWQLYDGAHALLGLGGTYPTETWLMRLVRVLAERRLDQLQRALPAEEQEMESQLKANMLEAQVEAALQGHELGHWEPVDEEMSGWEARCGKCGGTVYVSGKTLYSVLGERCGG